jgi:hypothetical protein
MVPLLLLTMAAALAVSLQPVRPFAVHPTPALVAVCTVPRSSAPGMLCSAAAPVMSLHAAGDEAPHHLRREDWLERAQLAVSTGGHEAVSQLALSALSLRSSSIGSSDNHSSSSSSRNAAEGGDEEPPLVELFVTAIGACADAGEWRDALKLLRELEDAGDATDLAPYTEAARACRAGGEWARAISLLNRVRERGHSMRGTVGLYSQVIGACDDAGEAAKAVEIYALGVQDKVFTHWHAGEPFSLDLHMFSQATAVSAVRYVLQHEVGNFLPADLKIITGWGKHTVEGSVPTLLPRIERLLAQELSPPLPYEKQTSLHCDRDGCRLLENDGCLVVPVHELFRWLVDSRPFETYCINVPSARA